MRPITNTNLKLWTSPALIFAKAEWCGHCQRAKPIMKQVARLLGSTVPVIEVDSDENPAAMKAWGVTSFPTIIFVDGKGGVHKYKGERLPDHIAGFVCSVANSGYDFCTRLLD